MNKIITISREFGSGGREFGCRLAENLGIKYYDKEIISKIAAKADLSEGYVKEVVEKRPMPLFPMTIGATILQLQHNLYLHHCHSNSKNQ